MSGVLEQILEEVRELRRALDNGERQSIYVPDHVGYVEGDVNARREFKNRWTSFAREYGFGIRETNAIIRYINLVFASDEEYQDWNHGRFEKEWMEERAFQWECFRLDGKHPYTFDEWLQAIKYKRFDLKTIRNIGAVSSYMIRTAVVKHLEG